MGGGFADAGEDHTRDRGRLHYGSAASPVASVCMALRAISGRFANPFFEPRGNPEALLRAKEARQYFAG
jgi:hypothetical protein